MTTDPSMTPAASASSARSNSAGPPELYVEDAVDGRVLVQDGGHVEVVDRLGRDAEQGELAAVRERPDPERDRRGAASRVHDHREARW